MDRIWNAVTAISRVAVWFGGAMLFFAAGLVTTEVTMRKLIPSIIGWGESLAGALGATGLAATFEGWQTGFRAFIFSGSDEISGYLFAVGTSWSLAYVLCTRGHIRIDALGLIWPPLFCSRSFWAHSWNGPWTSRGRASSMQTVRTPTCGCRWLGLRSRGCWASHCSS